MAAPEANTAPFPKTHSHLTDDFLDRVRRAYRLANEASQLPESEIWSSIAKIQTPVHEALMAPDNDAIRSIFVDPLSSDLYYGVDNLAASLSHPSHAAGYALRSQTDIILLADAIGLRRWLPPNAELAAYYHRVDEQQRNPDVEALLSGISEALGFDVRFPNPFRGEMGLSTSRGIASYRAIQALFQCSRVKQELRSLSSDSVLEIGPGMGRTAFYARAAGICDYTTVDLPIGVAAQACFLGAAIGPEAIWMIGDEPHTAAGRIQLLPSTARDKIERHFALTLNVDSSTEMGVAVCDDYVAWIAERSDAFLSVNHEANAPTIAAAGRRFLSDWQCRRHPYWMRHGYLDEIFLSQDERRRPRSSHLLNDAR